MLGLLDEQALGILHQRALDEEQRAVVLEAVDYDHVLAAQRVAWLTPLQLLGKAASKDDLPELPEFLLPPLLPVHEIVNLWIHAILPEPLLYLHRRQVWGAVHIPGIRYCHYRAKASLTEAA